MDKLKKAQVVIGLSILGILAGFSVNAMAGGFQLFEENVTNLGNAYAGTAAQADDASTEYFNPAGMTHLDNPQAVISGTFIDLDINAHINSATSSVILNTTPTPVAFPTVAVTGPDNNLEPGASNVIPSFHFVYPFDHKWALGFGANAPFGLDTTYPSASPVRFLATDSAITAVNVGPSVAYQFSPHFSIGAGIEDQYLSATFNQMVDFGTTSFNNKGDNWAWGWHVGGLLQFTPATRLGLTYHSKIVHDVTGDSSLTITTPSFIATRFGNITIPTATFSETGSFSANITMPDTTDLSFYHDFNAQWAMLAGLDYTRWSRIDSVTANFNGNVSSIVSQAVLPFNFRDTWRPSLGVNFKPIEKVTLRTGVAYDESPVPNNESRTFRLPDSNRYWLAFGAQYIINKALTLDAGYSHLFVSNSSANNTLVTNGQIPTSIPIVGGIPFTTIENAMGTFSSSVNEVGLQLTWNIA